MGANPSYRQLHRKVTQLEGELEKLKVAEETVKRQNDSLKALYEASLGIVDSLGEEELLESILEHAASISGTAHGYIYLVDPDEQTMQIRVGRGFFKSQIGRQVKRGEGMGGRVWGFERPILVKDYGHWPGRIEEPELDRLRSIVGIPLQYGERILGVIGLAHVDEERSFSGEDIITLERFGALALIALEKAKLYADVLHELAERKKTEGVLRESENRYKTFLESSPDPIVVYDIKGGASYVNPAFEQTFKISREELLGRQIDFVPRQCWPETRDAIRRMLSGQTIHLFETQRLTRDGETLDVQLSSTLYRNNKGEPQGNIVTLRDISAIKKAEKELAGYRNHLEDLVDERTEELARSNEKLAQEVEERRRAEKKLMAREKELQAQSHHLGEVNTALKVLLQQRVDDKKEIQENVLRNVAELVSPYIQRIASSRLDTEQRSLLDILETNLNNIISPFIDNLSSGLARLTPVEIRVASLVKAGKTNKEIAEILLVSKNTVLFHRHNIRTKLGLKNKKINLRTHLMRMD